ncbi:unnamed protein product [Leuciscus chuanchicus]
MVPLQDELCLDPLPFSAEKFAKMPKFVLQAELPWPLTSSAKQKVRCSNCSCPESRSPFSCCHSVSTLPPTVILGWIQQALSQPALSLCLIPAYCLDCSPPFPHNILSCLLSFK